MSQAGPAVLKNPKGPGLYTKLGTFINKYLDPVTKTMRLVGHKQVIFLCQKAMNKILG